MATIDLQANLGISPDALWESVGNFGGVSQWLDVVQESRLVGDDGTRRECVLPDGATLDETLTARDDGARSLTYTVTAGLPFTAHTATMQVGDAGNGRSAFTWVTEYTAADGAPDGFPEMFAGMLAGEVQKLEQRWP